MKVAVLSQPTPEDSADAGIVLTDLALKTIAFDRGAAAILNGGDGHHPDTFRIPEEILKEIRGCKSGDLSSLTIRFRRGALEYRCRACVIDSHSDVLPPRIVGLQLQRNLPTRDALSQMGAAYRLTSREQQALKWIALGLTSKEVANRMNISPNTVKAFLRLIMIKLGVTTRAAIVAKLLELH